MRAVCTVCRQAALPGSSAAELAAVQRPVTVPAGEHQLSSMATGWRCSEGQRRQRRCIPPGRSQPLPLLLTRPAPRAAAAAVAAVGAITRCWCAPRTLCPRVLPGFGRGPRASRTRRRPASCAGGRRRAGGGVGGTAPVQQVAAHSAQHRATLPADQRSTPASRQAGTTHTACTCTEGPGC